MHAFYETQPTAVKGDPLATDRHVRRFLQLAILAFWTPCIGIDGFLLWRDAGLDGTSGFVFGLLFRQALVFLALWFAVSLAHGLATGRRGPADLRPRRRARRPTPDVALINPGREHRGQ